MNGWVDALSISINFIYLFWSNWRWEFRIDHCHLNEDETKTFKKARENKIKHIYKSQNESLKYPIQPFQIKLGGGPMLHFSIP